jgi:hypothetical protein
MISTSSPVPSEEDLGFETLLVEPPSGLVPAIRASLSAKLQRLLQRPIVARIGEEPSRPRPADDDVPEMFRVLQTAARAGQPAATPAVRQDADGSFRMRISLDYDDLWRGCEKEILDAVEGTIEGDVTFLTDEQKLLLERSPREFLNLRPRPETAELVGYRKELVGGVERVVELAVAAPPESGEHVRHVAIVPNLIPLERQLQALDTIEAAGPGGPLAPLRALVGLSDAATLPAATGPVDAPRASASERLDEFQAACVGKALATPHFAVIQGPPGSGKTTVITAVIRRALERGQRVLVVSPTHVAVDNVVEKLAPGPRARGRDDLEVRSLPVRYAARHKRLLDAAAAYWVGPKSQRRAGTVSKRIERCLSAHLPLARELYARVDDEQHGEAPLSAALASVQAVICGTPIGVLSYEPVKSADAGAFDLLVVDEVSKMTLPEFLAIAVKARRWVLVGDPQQLPPFNNAEENATTLDDVLDPALDLVCSVGAVLERTKPECRRDQRLVVVSSAPERVARAVRAHVAAVRLDGAPPIGTLDEAHGPGVLVCEPDRLTEALAASFPVAARDRTFRPEQTGSVSLVVERGLGVARPAFASGTRFVEARLRAQAMLFDVPYSVYHAQPWGSRAGQKLVVVRMRNGIEKYLPSTAAVRELSGCSSQEAAPLRAALLERIAERFAVNTVSVYDWLVGLPTAHLDRSPLSELDGVARPLAPLRQVVAPFVGTLKKQYRMHSSLSRVPRELFYFGEALHDGAPDARGGCRVSLVQVDGSGRGEEWNANEVERICELLSQLDASGKADAGQKILVITPYREQERRLGDAIRAQQLARLDVEVCTLDRCQGREAEYVFVSLVRGRATPFMDAPKRWNVALTRAMEGLFVVGNVRSFLDEARDARRRAADRREEPVMSLLARILESYHRQITGGLRERI